MSLLVPSRLFHADHVPAGAFRSHAVAGGLIPGVLLRPLGVFCVDTHDRTFALTYDDGPDPTGTPRILDTLARYDAAATFFVLANAAKRHPELIRRIVSEGHEIALHGDTHESLLTMSAAAVWRRTRDARAAVEDIAGRRVRLYRPPYGKFTLAQALVLRSLGLTVIIWSGHASDWFDAPANVIAERVVGATFPGAIILLHDVRADPETLEPGERLPSFDRGEVLARALTATRAAGYREATVTDLISNHRRVHSASRDRMRRQ